MNGFLRILSIHFLVAGVRGQLCVEETLNCDDPVPTIFKLGDASCQCNDASQAGALKYTNGRVFLCVGTEWKTFTLEGDYGKQSSNPGTSCKDILDRAGAGQQLSNGVYWIAVGAGKWICNIVDRLID